MPTWLDGYYQNKKIVDNTVNPVAGGAVVADGTVTNAKLAAAAANTIKANATAASAANTDVAVAINTIVGRGPTGNIDDIAVQAGLLITDTQIGRAALSGDISAAANSNVTAIGADKVLTAHILDANITTAKIALNAVGNARAAKMPANTLKGNATVALADSGDITLSGGLSMDGTSVIKSKTGFAFNYLFSTAVTAVDPTSTYFKFNSATVPTVLYIHASSLGGRDLDAYLNLSNRGAFCFMSNNATSTAWGIFQATSIASDLGAYFTINGTLLTAVGTLPANNEECVIYYNPISSAADVDAINKTYLYLRRNSLNQIINESGTVISGTPVVANQAALPSVVDYDGFTYRVDNQGPYGVDYQSEGTVWSPTNGSSLAHIFNSTRTLPANADLAYPAATFVSPVATTLNAGTNIRLTSTGAHGLTSAGDVGKKIIVTAGTNWTAGTYTIKTIATNTTGLIIDLEEPFVASMGVPTIQMVGAEGYIIWPAATFTAAAATTLNAGSDIRLTSAGVHGLTSLVAKGKSIYVSAGTNWTVGFYTIKTIATDTTGLVIDLEEPWVAGMGTPTIALASGVEIPIASKTIPVLRANSSIHVNIDTSTGYTASTRTTNILLGGVAFCSHGNTSTGGSGAAISCKINNQGSTSVQLASMPLNHNGSTTSGSTNNPIAGTINTAVETTLTVTAECTVANVPYKVTHGEIYIRG